MTLWLKLPKIKEFTNISLNYVQRWHLFYCDHPAIGQQAVDQLAELAGELK